MTLKTLSRTITTTGTPRKYSRIERIGFSSVGGAAMPTSTRA
jgi:hypothetical protein